MKLVAIGQLLLVVVLGVTPWAPRVSAQPAPSSYETTGDAPLRRGPGNFHEVITTLPKGIKINVVGREGYWLKVESKLGGKPGYIDEKFARPITAPTAQAGPAPAAAAIAGPYRTLRELDLRETPSANARVVTRLPADIKVNVVRAEGDWLRVESKLGGKPGYLQRRDVERWVNR